VSPNATIEPLTEIRAPPACQPPLLGGRLRQLSELDRLDVGLDLASRQQVGEEEIAEGVTRDLGANRQLLDHLVPGRRADVSTSVAEHLGEPHDRLEGTFYPCQCR